MSDDLIRHLLDRIAALDAKIDRIAASVAVQGNTIAALEARVAAQVQCPNPGACQGLREELNQVSDEVEKHKIIVAKMEGGWKLLVVLCSVCSTLGGLVGWVVSHFTR